MILRTEITRLRFTRCWCKQSNTYSTKELNLFHFKNIVFSNSLYESLFSTTALSQNLKMLGLPGGEAHRLDQYISKVSIAFDHLSYLKEYRTPQAFRAFARVYILTVGALYGPYYCYVGRGLDKVEHNFGVAIAFACGIQLAMSGLFSVMKGLEDPFSGPGGVDNINVPELVGATRDILLQMERDCMESW